MFHFEAQITLFALSVLFILISSRIPISALSLYIKPGLVILAIIIFFARPLSVFLSTKNEKGMTIFEKIFLASLAPRGIVSASLATLFALSLERHQAPQSMDTFLPLAFIIILGTIVFYAAIAPLMARLPGVHEPPQKGIVIVGANPFALMIAKEIQKRNISIVFIDTNPHLCQNAWRHQFEAHKGSGFDAGFIESLDLKGIGMMMALSPNHELNVLSCQTFSKFLGKDNVFRFWDRRDTWKESRRILETMGICQPRYCFFRTRSTI